MDGTGLTAPYEDRALIVRGLTADSRQVAPGFLFAALPGSRSDGRRFVADALRRGAAVILAPLGTDLPPVVEAEGRRVPVIHDGNPRRSLAMLAARFHGKQPATVAAVTGTNGKTSVVWFLRQIWASAGRVAASLGTLGVTGPGIDQPSTLTTLDAPALHALLAELAEAGIGAVAMEASSHGLDQYRLDGVRIAAGGFTNLTRDHLDYHGSTGAYLAAKLRLFGELIDRDGTAVVCADGPFADVVVQRATDRGLRTLTYGRGGTALRLVAIESTATGQTLSLDGVLGKAEPRVHLPLVGEFQALNALCAAGLAVATGVEPAQAIASLASLTGVPGRLERVIAVPGGGAAFVDYAHTPDALATVLTALRRHVPGRLILVFGCGGDRDPGKRPEMGRIAAAAADQVIITDDNPRQEEPAAIRRAIREACPKAVEIGDREAAIRAAMGSLQPRDVLLVAGKGHERGQIIGERIVPFDDAEVIRRVARESGW